jgi:hypothetical protein
MDERTKNKIIEIQHKFRDGYITRNQRDKEVLKLKNRK